MALHLNTAETGQTSGTAATSANTGSGSAGDALTVTTSATGTIVFSSTQKHRGALAYKIDGSVSGDVARVEWSLAAAQTATEIYIYLTAYPSAEMALIEHRNTSARMAAVQITTAGNCRLYDASGNALWLSTNPLALNTWHRLLLVSKTGTNASSPYNGAIDFSIYSGSNLETTTPTEKASDSAWFSGLTSTTVNTGTANHSTARVGKLGSGNTWTGIYVDDIQWNDNSMTAPGPVASLSGSVSPTSGTAGSTVITATVSGVASTAYLITWGDGATSSITTNSSGAATATHTYATAGTYTVTVA